MGRGEKVSVVRRRRDRESSGFFVVHLEGESEIQGVGSLSDFWLCGRFFFRAALGSDQSEVLALYHSLNYFKG